MKSTRIYVRKRPLHSESLKSKASKRSNFKEGDITEHVLEQRSSSPESNCSICLGQMEDKSFTDSCFHMFCFSCLTQWARINPVCPLCKQSFNKIYHSIKSVHEYEEYNFVSEPPHLAIISPDPFVIQPLDTYDELSYYNQNTMELSGALQFELSRGFLDPLSSNFLMPMAFSWSNLHSNLIRPTSPSITSSLFVDVSSSDEATSPTTIDESILNDSIDIISDQNYVSQNYRLNHMTSFRRPIDLTKNIPSSLEFDETVIINEDASIIVDDNHANRRRTLDTICLSSDDEDCVEAVLDLPGASTSHDFIKNFRSHRKTRSLRNRETHRAVLLLSSSEDEGEATNLGLDLRYRAKRDQTANEADPVSGLMSSIRDPINVPNYENKIAKPSNIANVISDVNNGQSNTEYLADGYKKIFKKHHTGHKKSKNLENKSLHISFGNDLINQNSESVIDKPFEKYCNNGFTPFSEYISAIPSLPVLNNLPFIRDASVFDTNSLNNSNSISKGMDGAVNNVSIDESLLIDEAVNNFSDTKDSDLVSTSFNNCHNINQSIKLEDVKTKACKTNFDVTNDDNIFVDISVGSRHVAEENFDRASLNCIDRLVNTFDISSANSSQTDITFDINISSSDNIDVGTSFEEYNSTILLDEIVLLNQVNNIPKMEKNEKKSLESINESINNEDTQASCININSLNKFTIDVNVIEVEANVYENVIKSEDTVEIKNNVETNVNTIGIQNKSIVEVKNDETTLNESEIDIITASSPQTPIYIGSDEEEDDLQVLSVNICRINKSNHGTIIMTSDEENSEIDMLEDEDVDSSINNTNDSSETNFSEDSLSSYDRSKKIKIKNFIDNRSSNDDDTNVSIEDELTDDFNFNTIITEKTNKNDLISPIRNMIDHIGSGDPLSNMTSPESINSLESYQLRNHYLHLNYSPNIKNTEGGNILNLNNCFTKKYDKDLNPLTTQLSNNSHDLRHEICHNFETITTGLDSQLESSINLKNDVISNEPTMNIELLANIEANILKSKETYSDYYSPFDADKAFNFSDINRDVDDAKCIANENVRNTITLDEYINPRASLNTDL